MTVIQHDHQHAEFIRVPELIKQSPIPTLRALLIGIDTYRNFTQLSGAVKDMESIYDFLHSDLSVPDSRITRLTNEQATRSGIIDAMEGLSKDPSINRFDPILIFYAGHGCEVDSPLANYRDKAQCLVPWDMGNHGTDGHPVSPIPDYIISALLNELAVEKGNNITVIFDSCHSAGSTRGVRKALAKTASKLNAPFSHQDAADRRSIVLGFDSRARSLDPQDLPPLTLEMDKRIIRRAQRRKQWRTIIAFVRSHLLFLHTLATPEFNEAGTKVTIPQSSLRKAIPKLIGFSRSHVLLAACGHAEQAYECAKCHRGYFTSALLQVLRSRWLQELKYKQCFEEFPKLRTPGPQNPVCEGSSTSRLFFQVPLQTRNARAVSFTLQQLSKGYFLKLGDAQGVFPGSKYGIYEDRTIPKGLASGYLPSPALDRPLWGYFTADPCTSSETTLYPFYSWCEFEKNAKLPLWPRAQLLQLGVRGDFSLRVFVSDALKLILNPNAIVRAKQGMVLVDSRHIGTVVLDIERGDSEDMTTFELVGFPGVIYKCHPDSRSVHRVLISMSQWMWHRSRVPQATFRDKPMAKLTLYELGKAGPRSLPVEQDGSTSIQVSPTTRYALKVTSQFSKRLYAYLFYFSTARQSIRPLYLGIYGSGHIDPSLEPYGELNIGYNNDDMIPGALSFTTAPDEGYFQLFLATSPGDFDSVAQPSPFIESHAISIGNEYEYGDGLEIRGHASSPIEKEPSPISAFPNSALGNCSADIVVAQFLEISMSERQQANTNPTLEDSIRGILPDSVTSELLAARASQWGVVSLKVKCRKADA
ncbi:ICE-like protease (caspase) p20 domain protein [Rhizoctonia solani 123E]|uniref:ICE-like protease (Caspase) p20 domain protein n=1 Tax=Rhizoctonia solani 123E TaxID=1423351 RepID=A0A074RPS6_9AGAM|nr:ICE-like protease (caspase) p20 domain protein [Rhizoctonia solani 123E]